MDFIFRKLGEVKNNPVLLTDALEKAYYRPDHFMVEQLDNSPKRIKGFLFVCSHESEGLIRLINSFPNLISDFEEKVNNLDKDNSLVGDCSIVETPFKEKGYKLGIHICKYTLNKYKDLGRTIDPLKYSPENRNIEQLAVLYSSNLNSEVDYNKHNKLLHHYLDIFD